MEIDIELRPLGRVDETMIGHFCGSPESPRSIASPPSRRNVVSQILALIWFLLPAPLYAQAVSCIKSAAVRGDSAQVSACRWLVDRDTSNADAWEALAISLSQSGDYSGAVGPWRRVTLLRPAQFSAHYNLGLMYELTRKPSLALDAFKAALGHARDLRSTQTSVWHIGVSYANAGRLQDALSWFREASALDSTDASAWHYAAFAAASLGRWKEAMSYWARTDALAPNFVAQAQPAERAMYDRALKAAGRQPLAPVVHTGVVNVTHSP